MARVAWLALLIVAGCVLGLLYTLPPVATSYRPFVGEWLGGFPGLLLSGLGAYAIKIGFISLVALTALSAHALVCMGMLIVHHYLDAPMDANATPPKRTTVVALGPRNARRYAGGMAATATILYGSLGVVHPAFLLGCALTIPAVWIHLRTVPTDLKSVTRNELRIIQLGIAAGRTTSVASHGPCGLSCRLQRSGTWPTWRSSRLRSNLRARGGRIPRRRDGSRRPDRTAEERNTSAEVLPSCAESASS